MSLELRRQRDGRLRPNWYARYEVNGQRFTVNLGLKIKGVPPASGSLVDLNDPGDTEFQCSRTEAQAKLNALVEEVRSKRNSTHLVERIYESKTGEPIRSVKLEALADLWAKLPRRRQLNATYEHQCKSSLTHFAMFVQREHPKVRELGQVTRNLAMEFLEAESNRKISAKTWNDKLKVLRVVFRQLLPAGFINPLATVPTRETETAFRQPFTPEELAAILDAARVDEFIRPIIIVGMCTAMRRGDCCLLDWKDVDLANRFITVKTSKTEQTVSIPIFPMLLEELEKKAETLKSGLDGGEEKKSSGRIARNDRRVACATPTQGYVFPEQAKMYLENPDGITWRVKKILAVSLIPRAFAGSGENKPQAATAGVPAEAEVRRRAAKHIASVTDSAKRQRMEQVLDGYLEGQSVEGVAAATGVSKSSVSGYLNELEAGTGCRIVRGRPDGSSAAALLKRSPGLLLAERKHGLRRASVRDFHSFRVTWVTLALTAGVPLELVQKVTGHKTAEVVLKHYFQPGREAFREALNKAMPKLLMSGAGSIGGTTSQNQKIETLRPVAEKQDKAIRAILERSTAKTWKQDQARVLEMLKG